MTSMHAGTLRIVVGADGSPNSLVALHRAAAVLVAGAQLRARASSRDGEPTLAGSRQAC
jgi:nucleotide-binding universal stress UspA family protein